MGVLRVEQYYVEKKYSLMLLRQSDTLKKNLGGFSLEAAHWRQNLSGAQPDGKAIWSTLTQLPVLTSSKVSIVLTRYLCSPEAANCILL